MSSTILNLTQRSPIDGTENAVLATSGANWKAPLGTVAWVFGSGTTIGSNQTNYLTFNGEATTVSPQVAASGGDTIVGVDIVGKGTNSVVRLMSGTAVTLTANSDSSAVNYIQINGADTGGAPQFVAVGSDPNIALSFASKGNLNINFVNGAVTSFVVQADSQSAVNIPVSHSSATGVSPYIGAFSGTDTDVNLCLRGQGKGGFGYLVGFGQGGTVTQLTSRTTSVTLDKISGQITMFSAAGVVGTASTFTVNNACIVSTDVVIANIQSATNTYTVDVSGVAGGSFILTVTDVTGVATDAPVINFAIIKSSAS